MTVPLARWAGRGGESVRVVEGGQRGTSDDEIPAVDEDTGASQSEASAVEAVG